VTNGVERVFHTATGYVSNRVDRVRPNSDKSYAIRWPMALTYPGVCVSRQKCLVYDEYGASSGEKERALLD